MHRVTILYAVPDDAAAFDEHYFSRHVPLVAPIPGLARFTWSKPRPLGGEPSVYLVAELDFEDAGALKTALASPEMTAAGEDAARLGVPMTMFSGEVVDAETHLTRVAHRPQRGPRTFTAAAGAERRWPRAAPSP